MVREVALRLDLARRLDRPRQHQAFAAVTLGPNVTPSESDKGSATVAFEMAETHPLLQRDDGAFAMAAPAFAIARPTPPHAPWPALSTLVVDQRSDWPFIQLQVIERVHNQKSQVFLARRKMTRTRKWQSVTHQA